MRRPIQVADQADNGQTSTLLTITALRPSSNDQSDITNKSVALQPTMRPQRRSLRKHEGNEAVVAARREAKRLRSAARKASEHSDPVIIQARLQSRKLQEDVKVCVDAMRERFLGQGRNFAGELLTSEWTLFHLLFSTCSADIRTCEEGAGLAGLGLAVE
jgi:hypothetical protein